MNLYTTFQSFKESKSNNIVNLNSNYWIEGFETRSEMIAKHNSNLKSAEIKEELYYGKISNVKNDLAKKVVSKAVSGGDFFKDYIKQDRALIDAKESLETACEFEYCIIYEKF